MDVCSPELKRQPLDRDDLSDNIPCVWVKILPPLRDASLSVERPLQRNEGI